MDEVSLHCIDCGNRWSILCPVTIENGEEVTKIGIFDDLCPICESQGEIDNELEEERQAR